MLDYIYNLLVTKKDFIGSIAAIATIFALFIPLPIFVISEIKKRRDEARDRAFNLISQSDSGEAKSARDSFLKITNMGKLKSVKTIQNLNESEINILRQFMNHQELISIHLNTSQVDEKIFLRFWKSAFLQDWERVETYIEYLRRQFENPKIFVEWEQAVTKARSHKIK